MRADAKSQINYLQIAALLQIVNKNRETIRSTLNTVKRIELEPLSADRVNRLFGIGG